MMNFSDEIREKIKQFAKEQSQRKRQIVPTFLKAGT